MRKVLIIKTGLHETFAPLPEQVGVSLGDVLRTTSLLSLFHADQVDWLTSANAKGLLSNNSKIQHLFTSYQDVNFDSYDLILNFEIQFSQLDSRRQKIVGLIQEGRFQTLSENQYSDSEFNQLCVELGLQTWQQKLFYLTGETFQDQPYVLETACGEKTFDIGLNWKAGPKWPSKAMDRRHWDGLFESLSKEFSMSWQEGFDNLEHYAHWISQCKVLISNDSLGMHIAFALGVPCFTLFGPTKASEIHFYHGSKPWFFPVPAQYDCLGCLKSHCPKDRACVEFFDKESFIHDFKNWHNQLKPEDCFAKSASHSNS